MTASDEAQRQVFDRVQSAFPGRVATLYTLHELQATAKKKNKKKPKNCFSNTSTFVRSKTYGSRWQRGATRKVQSSGGAQRRDLQFRVLSSTAGGGGHRKQTAGRLDS